MVGEAEPVLPDETGIGAPFWAAAHKGELAIQRCQVCRTYSHPPDVVCGHCGSHEFEFAGVSGRGILYSYTTSYLDGRPQVVGVVELVEQPLLLVACDLTWCLEDPGVALEVGLPMRLCPDLAGRPVVPCFEPVWPPSGS